MNPLSPEEEGGAGRPSLGGEGVVSEEHIWAEVSNGQTEVQAARRQLQKGYLASVGWSVCWGDR